jgi:hypothetical protein
LTLAAAAGSPSAAQVALNRNARALFAADPVDARGIWVNPAALGLPGTLSVYADVTFGLEPPYETGSPISQFSLGFNSYFLAFAYQSDRLPDTLGTGTVRGHAVRLALWGRDGRVGAAAATTWYGGEGDGGVGVDLGVVYRAGGLLDLGAVVANIGHPSVRGTELAVRFRPAATLRAGTLFALEAQGEFQRDSVLGYAVGTRLRLPALPLELAVRLDTDDRLRRRSFSFGLTWGGENRVGALVTTSGDLRVTDAASLHFVSERSNQPRRRGGR